MYQIELIGNVVVVVAAAAAAVVEHSAVEHQVPSSER